MDKYYAGQSNLGDTIAMGSQRPPSKDTVDTLVRTLADRLWTLSNEVISLSERIHGIQNSSGGIGAASPALPAWADELRDAAGPAHVRGECAVKEIFRIRETLGL